MASTSSRRARRRPRRHPRPWAFALALAALLAAVVAFGPQPQEGPGPHAGGDPFAPDAATGGAAAPATDAGEGGMTEPAETGAVATDGETAGAAPDDAASTDGGATGVAPDDAETGATETAPEVEPRPWEVPEGHSPAPVERLEWQVKLDVVGCATQVVEGYRQAGAVLVHAGWVDLLGRVWGCVASGPGWVDVCLVRETDAGSSEVEVARMEVAEWERAYAG